MVLNGFVVLSYALDPAKRKYPQILPAFIAASYAIWGFFYFIYLYFIELFLVLLFLLLVLVLVLLLYFS